VIWPSRKEYHYDYPIHHLLALYGKLPQLPYVDLAELKPEPVGNGSHHLHQILRPFVRPQ
jgi:hypothetical protein